MLLLIIIMLCFPKEMELSFGTRKKYLRLFAARVRSGSMMMTGITTRTMCIIMIITTELYQGEGHLLSAVVVTSAGD